MFCYQCEQTCKGTGCTAVGVCGKDAITATLQDLVVYAAKGIGQYAHRAAKLGARSPVVNLAVLEALFSTVTNVNFDPARLEALLRRLAGVRDQARHLYEAACTKAGTAPETLAGPAAWTPAPDRAGLLRQGEEIAITTRQSTLGPEVTGVQELLTYGLKGMAAYADHAQILDFIIKRDAQDSGRKNNPLRKADDAHYLDSTSVPRDQVVEAIVELFNAAVK